jgi:hypothetical protein
VPWYGPFFQALRAGAYFAAHVLIAAALIGAIYVIQWLLVQIGDPKLFDWIPIRYIFDAMDFGILVAFVVFGVVEAFLVFQEHARGARVAGGGNEHGS